MPVETIVEHYDERVIRERGSKRVMLKNVQEAKFESTLKPISKLVLRAQDQKDLDFDSFFTQQNRFYGGLRFIGAVGTLGGEFSYAGKADAAVKAITLKAGLVF